jgi:DNA mismatch endonuclease (patch repair protein)
MPATNRSYWQAKIARNMERDKKTKRDMKKLGWKTATVWECETRDPEKLARLISRKLGLGPRT